MPTTRHHRAIRVAIVIDVHDEPLLTVLIWARRCGDELTSRPWEHGVLAHLAAVQIDEHPSTP